MSRHWTAFSDHRSNAPGGKRIPCGVAVPVVVPMRRERRFWQARPPRPSASNRSSYWFSRPALPSLLLSAVRFFFKPSPFLSLLPPIGAELLSPRFQFVRTSRALFVRSGSVESLPVGFSETASAFRLSAIWAEKQEEFRAFIRLKALNNPCL